MKYKIIVDKQNKENPSTEKREYEIDIEELHARGKIYDSLVITKDEDYVIRRLKKNKYNVLNILEKPIKEVLNEVNIELFEGENYIYLLDMVGNKLCAEYLIKNDFTDMYVTKNEMNSVINQTAGQIELAVNQKLTKYVTEEQLEGSVTELNSAITQKADEITSTVLSTYITKEELNSTKSEIKQTTDSISNTVSKKIGEDEIISKINQSAEEIAISADKIDINGKAVKFKTNIATDYHFTQADIERAQEGLKEGNFTEDEEELYDVNGDGIVNLIDLQLIIRAIKNNNGYINLKGTLEIDPYSAKRTLILRDEKGKIVTSIGLSGVKTKALGAEYIEVDNVQAKTATMNEAFVCTLKNGVFERYSPVVAEVYKNITSTVNGNESCIRLGEMLICWGRQEIKPTSANVPTNINIQFPNSFSSEPCVLVTPYSTVPGKEVTGTAAAKISKTGVSIYLTRTNTTATGVNWLAIGQA